MAPLTGSLSATGSASKSGQAKRLLKNGECAQDFWFDTLKQLFGMPIPREGKLRLTRRATQKMHEYQLTTAILDDVFRYGEAKQTTHGTFMMVRRYPFSTVGFYYVYDRAEDTYVITTCWKGGV